MIFPKFRLKFHVNLAYRRILALRKVGKTGTRISPGTFDFSTAGIFPILGNSARILFKRTVCVVPRRRGVSGHRKIVSPDSCPQTGFGVRFQFLQNRKLQGFLYRNSDRFFCQCVSVFTGHAGPSPGAQERTFTCTCSKLKFRSLTCTCTCTYTCTMTSGCRDLDSFKNQGSSRKLANRAAVQGFHQILVV